MRRAADVAMLAVGVAAIVLAVVLFGVLGESVEPTRQFVVTFEEQAVEAPAQEAAASESGAVEVVVPVRDGNLSAIEVTVAFADDVAASDPDLVRIEAIDPSGTPRLPVLEAANPLPASRPGSAPPDFQALERVVTLVVPVHVLPSTQVASAISAKETADQAHARLAPSFVAGGAGDWTLRITVQAGDCPSAELDPQRAAACRTGSPDGVDAGNPVRIVQFRSFHWHASLAAV